jgi:hypothetical protein
MSISLYHLPQRFTTERWHSMSMSSIPLGENELLARQSCISEHEDVES